MIEDRRRGGERVVRVKMELGKEKYNERSEQGQRRDGEAGTASKSPPSQYVKSYSRRQC